MTSPSGFSVVYTAKPKIAHEVYWSVNLQEAVAYAEMVYKNHGHLYSVHIDSDSGRIQEWDRRPAQA